MKKVLIGGLICTLFLTGCGEKTLTCNNVEEDFGMTLSDEIKLTFDKDGEEIVKVKLSAELEVDDADESELLEFEEMVKEDYSSVEDIGGKVKTSVKDNVIKVNLSYDATQLTDDQKEDLQSQNLYFETNYNESKEALEDAGYTCK